MLTMQDVLREWFKLSTLQPGEAIERLAGMIGMKIAAPEGMPTREEMLLTWSVEEGMAGELQAAMRSEFDAKPPGGQSTVVDIRDRRGPDGAR